MLPLTSSQNRRLPAAVLISLACVQVSAATAKADGWAFALYVQSLSAQVLARTCEKADPGYLARFTPLYESWAAHHAQQIARGERFYLETVRNDPNARDNPRLAQIEASRQALTSPEPQRTAPIPHNAQMFSVCESNLATITTR